MSASSSGTRKASGSDADPPLHQLAGLGAQAVAVRAAPRRREVRDGRSGLRQELVERLEVPRLAGPAAAASARQAR